MAPEDFEEIEYHFAQRRGTPMFRLSHKDIFLLNEWIEQGIPLAIVIEAIDSVFEKAGERKVPSSLRYCRHAVKELWAERRDLQIGASEGVPEEGAEATLNALADALESAAPSFAPRVRELAREKSVPRIEEKLIDLEHELALSLATEEIRAEAARAAEGNARVEEAHLRRLVRERYALPRLTLFV